MRANIAPLVADTGELRLMRRMGSFAYGRWEVEWPKDFEAPKLDDGVKLGYVARMMKEDPGLSGRRFSRRDVAINAVDKTSDVEQILDAAESAVKEHVFFESELTGVGLAHQVPGEDFQLGDLVPVLVCGRVLPDQLVTNIRWALQDGVSECFVQIGSQVLADDLERARQNREVTRAIAQERRERVVDVSNAAASAAEAKAAAKVADRKAGAADAKAETADGKAEDALEKWRRQKDELDQVQSELIRKNAEWNRLQDVGLKELEAQQEAMKRYVELSRPGTVTADSWDPVWAGPVQVSYPSRNRIQLYLNPSSYTVGASVLGVARVSALSGYSFSFTADIRAGETVTPSVGSFEAFQQVSVTVHPIVDFASVLKEERGKRGLQ
ncbi:hypothetical protein [Corynebacterium diphtheriae]|uniref:hypothetical protein n=1 Tax=Corynebacterium diphtheriae TaxID=1717 RepID=UPI002119DF90|nr:hypothetical protein [Corynebacterium diphtheriae]